MSSVHRKWMSPGAEPSEGWEHAPSHAGRPRRMSGKAPVSHPSNGGEKPGVGHASAMNVGALSDALASRVHCGYFTEFIKSNRELL